MEIDINRLVLGAREVGMTGLGIVLAFTPLWVAWSETVLLACAAAGVLYWLLADLAPSAGAHEQTPPGPWGRRRLGDRFFARLTAFGPWYCHHSRRGTAGYRRKMKALHALLADDD